MTTVISHPVHGTQTIDLQLLRPQANCANCSWRDDGNTPASPVTTAKEHAEAAPGHRVVIIRTTAETITWTAAT